MNNTFAIAVRGSVSLISLLGLLQPTWGLQAQTNEIDSLQVFGLIERAREDMTAGESNTSRLDSLYDLVELIERADWKATVVCALTEIKIVAKEVAEAESLSQQGLKLVRDQTASLPDTMIDLVYFLRAALLLEQGKWDEFERYLDSSFQILHRLPKPSPSREARNAIRMSYLTYNQGNLTKTIEWTKSGIDKMLALDHLTKADSTQMASLYNNIAFLNDASGRFDEVVPNYNYAMQYDPTVIGPYSNQAMLLRSTQPSRSIALSKQALEIIPKTSFFNRCNAFSNIVSASLVLAGALEDTSHFQVALQYHDSILAMTPLARPGDYPFDANSHGLFSDYFARVARKRDVEKAWHHFQNNYELAQKSYSYNNMRGLKTVMLPVTERQARLSIMRGDFPAADKAIKEVNVGYHSNQSELHPNEFSINSKFLLDNSSTLAYPLTYLSLMVEWSATLDDPMVKLAEADRVFRIVDSTYDQLLRENELEIEQLRFDRLYTRGAAIAIKAYEATQDRAYLEKAHARMEKLFSLDLFENHVQARLKNSTDAESAIYREKLVLREEIDLRIRDVPETPEEEGLLDSLNRAYVVLLDKLGTSYQNNVATSLEQISLDELSGQLTADDAMLYYLYDKLGATLYGLCVTHDTVVPIQQDVEDLEALVYQTNLLLADPASTSYADQLKKLHGVFIDPIKDFIAGRDLIISSIGALELVPYDLLLDADENYLCFDHSIRHIYSAGWNAKEIQENVSGTIYGYTSSPKDAVAAVVRGGEEFTNLKAAREEIEFLKSEFNAKVFLDEKSTKQIFKETANDASVLHLAMHGVVNPLEPIKSRIVFDLEGNENGDLHYHEIDDLKIGAQLVTLSACNSGKGMVRGAGSIASLARAFNYAGCPNVVQTLWSVNDESSLDLMKGFYQNLKNGQAVPAALTAAKQQFYNSAPQKWKHPYYWGGYIYNGQDISIELQKKKSILLRSIVPLLLVVSLVFFLIRRYL